MKRMKAEKYNRQNVIGWSMSEKLNGVFGRWTGSILLSSEGNEYHAPKWFTDQLPVDVILEGELYIDRGMLYKIIGIVRKDTPIDSEWNLVGFHVFDAPEIKGNFRERLSAAAKILTGCAVAQTVGLELCESVEHLDQFYSNLINDGSEGVMLHCPNFKYEYRKTHRLLKYKPIDSEEGKIVGYKEGKDKYAGLREAVLCKWNKIVFKLGGFNDERYEIPEVGSLVTFSFHGLTDNGVPLNASFVAERNYE